MAADIIVKFKPMGHEAIIDAIKRLEKAQKGFTQTTKKTTKNTDKLDKSTGRLRGNMSMFQNSLATIRSKLLIYNFAMGMGIRQTIQFAQAAAKVADMSRAFTTLSKSGENASLEIGKISNAVKGTMSQMSLFKQANNAMILGITRNTDEMAEMFKIAQTLGAALGVDTAHAVESLVTGIGRQSRLMLDNIGIIVKADEAYKAYADRLGTTVDKLTDAEKKQAFFTAAMDSARKKAKELGNQQLTARDQFNKFNATMEDFTNFIGEKTSPMVLGFFNSFGETLKRITETDLETTIRQLQGLGVSVENLAKLNKLLGMEQAREQIQISQKEISKHLKTLIPLDGIEKLEGFGVKIEEFAKVIFNSGNEIRDFKIDPSLLNQQKLQAEFDRIIDMADQFSIGLAETEDPEQREFFQERIEHFTKLATAYQAILLEMEKLNQANKTLKGTNEEVSQTNQDVSDTGEKVAANLKNQMSAVASAAKGFAALGKELGMGARAVAAIQAVGALANAHSAASDVLADKTVQPTWLRVAAAAGMYAEGFSHVLAIRNAGKKLGGGSAPQFAEGGYVGGRPHSQGGTIIEAERGEFVMSRNAVESIGLETLNQMNQSGGGGGINVTVTGNVLTQDFVEGELAESIKEAVRRGSDFGLS